MLAAAIHHQLHKVEPAMRGHPFAVEAKIDGERMLCHKEGARVSWYSRSATNYTDKYGPHLTPWVLRCVTAHNCILDGEVVGWDWEHLAFLPFKENRSIVVDLPPPSFSPSSDEGGSGGGRGGGGRGKHDNPQPRTLVYIVFDVVYLDDGPNNTKALLDECVGATTDVSATERRPGSITHLPLRARRALLERIVRPEHRKLEIVRQQRIEDASTETRLERLMAAFDEALQVGWWVLRVGKSIIRSHRHHHQQNIEEGLLVKDLESPYVLGERGRGLQYWMKMKAEYSDLTTNLDVIVLGAYYSEGKRRSGRLASFLLGVAESPAEATEGGGAAKGAQQHQEQQEEEEGLLLIPWANPPQAPRANAPKASAAPSSSSAPNLKQEPPPAEPLAEDESQLKPKCFYTVGRCGSGITYQEWEELEKRLAFKPWPKGGRCPKFMKPWKPARKDIPDFYVEPSASVVLEVKCMSIEESDSFSSGFALR